MYDEKLNIVDAIMHNIVFIDINSVIVLFWFAYNKQFIDVGGSPCQVSPLPRVGYQSTTTRGRNFSQNKNITLLS